MKAQRGGEGSCVGEESVWEEKEFPSKEMLAKFVNTVGFVCKIENSDVRGGEQYE